MTSSSPNKSLKNLASGASVSLFFGIIGYAMMFVFKVSSARYFGPEKFGLFEMSNTILSIASIIALMGIHAGVSRYISVYEERNEVEKLRGYIDFIFRLPILSSLLVSIFVFIFAERINSFFGFSEVFTQILQIIAIAIPFRVFNEIIYQIFYAKNKVLIQNIGNNIIEKIILLIGVIGVFIYNLDILSLILFLFLSFFIAFFFNLYYFKSRIRFKESKNKIYDYKGWFSFSLPLFFAGFFAFFINWSDNLVIGKILDSRNLGIYAVSFSLASFLLFFQASFVSVFIPTMSRLYARKKNREFSNVYAKAQNWVFGLSLPFALMLIFFSKEIIRVVYGDGFILGERSLVILTIGILVGIYVGMNAPLLRVVKNTKFLFKTKIIMASANVILNIILIQKIGVIGAAISTAFIMGGEQLIYMIKVKKYFNVSHNNIVNFKLIIIGVALIFIFKYLINAWEITLSISVFIVTALIYLTSYVLVVINTKTLEKNDYLIFKSIIINESR